jgi:hypothetical protein
MLTSIEMFSRIMKESIFLETGLKVSSFSLSLELSMLDLLN